MNNFEKTLREIRKQEAKLTALKEGARQNAIEQANSIIAQFALTPEDLTFGVPANDLFEASECAESDKRRAVVPPKYRAPDGTTWSGRGRPKAAIQRFIDQGVPLESMLIEPEKQENNEEQPL